LAHELFAKKGKAMPPPACPIKVRLDDG